MHFVILFSFLQVILHNIKTTIYKHIITKLNGTNMDCRFLFQTIIYHLMGYLSIYSHAEPCLKSLPKSWAFYIHPHHTLLLDSVPLSLRITLAVLLLHTNNDDLTSPFPYIFGDIFRFNLIIRPLYIYTYFDTIANWVLLLR